MLSGLNGYRFRERAARQRLGKVVPWQRDELWGARSGVDTPGTAGRGALERPGLTTMQVRPGVRY